MIYRIADLYIEVPPVGDMPERMRAYEAPGAVADITITEGELRPNVWGKNLSMDYRLYLETGWAVHRHLPDFDGFMLHASAVVVDGYAYLFSGPCGMGKSTHTGLYLQQFGDRAVIINDDKPILRRVDGVWRAYGTPWSGSEGINQNLSAPIAGVCFLQRGDTSLTRLAPKDTVRHFVGQLQRDLRAPEMLKQLQVLDGFVREVPVFELYNHAQPEDALLTYTEMTKASKEQAL